MKLQNTVHSVLSTAKSILYTFCGIHRLPPEVLIRVFEMLPRCEKPKRPDGIDSWQDRYGWRTSQWNRVSSACRHWRHIILNTPSLWSTIVDNILRAPLPDHAINTFLTRSGRYPLLVCLNDGSIRLPSLVQQVPRVYELTLRSYGGTTVPSDFTQPASMLQSLYVSYEPQKLYSVAPIVHIPPMFGNQTPALRHLVMDHIASWSNNTFGHLTHLHLSGVARISDREPFLPALYTKFLHLLRCNPSLEVLFLEHLGIWIHPSGFYGDVSFERVVLKHVKSFSYTHARVPQVKRLLSDLELPDDVCMSLHSIRTT